MNKLLQRRFRELEAQMAQIEATKEEIEKSMFVSRVLLTNWAVKVRSLLLDLCGKQSQYFKQFEYHDSRSYYSNYPRFQSLGAVFLAVKEDFEGGYLMSVKSLIQADVFDAELEQASELFKKQHVMAAAVIAGVVLETALRELCDREDIPHTALDKMNSDLTKAGVYTKNRQKRITAWAGIRNSAAHGKPEEFTKNDVEAMIRDVGDFIEMALVNQVN